jgi:pimeloyl-ACP methyl ester carboxylesterase|tara:strand:- start:192 stop:980 length:789 start_codon:yes stop_codon:yes gene_type:complete
MDFNVNGNSVHAATGSRAINRDEPAIILLHGAGMDRTVWQLQTRNIAFMGRQTYAVDFPGHGRSEGDPLASIPEMAEWVLAFMDAAKIETATIVGHSMGALVAIEFAGKHPKKLNKLCLMGIAEAMPVHPDLLAAAQRNELLGPELIVYWGVGEKAQIGGHPQSGLWVHGATKTLLDLSGPGVLFNDLAACNVYEGALVAAKNVTCETHFILGRDDKMTPAKKAKSLADAIRIRETKIIEQCGHMMMTERPNQVYDALVEFI